MSKKINVPIGANIEFNYLIDDTEYTISMIYKEEGFNKWYISIQWNNNNTYLQSLVATPCLFYQYKNIMPHCFFCETKNGFNPSKSNSFEKLNGDSELKICSWEEFENNIL